MCGVRGGGTFRLRKLAGNGIRVDNFLLGNIRLRDLAGKPIDRFSDLEEGMQVELRLKGDIFPLGEIVESISGDTACLRQA